MVLGRIRIADGNPVCGAEQTRDLKEERQQLKEDLIHLRNTFEQASLNAQGTLSTQSAQHADAMASIEVSHQAALRAAAIAARDSERAVATERLAHTVGEERSTARRAR